VADRPEDYRFSRYPIQLPLLLKPKGPGPIKVGVGWTRNLSQGGACVELAERLSPGTSLRARLRKEHGTIEMGASVAWVGQPEPGNGGGVPHGLNFTQLLPDQHQALSILLVSAGLKRPAGLRVSCEVPITCHLAPDAGPPVRGRTHDIGRGGLLLHLPQILPPGTALLLTLHTPQGPLTAEGTIVWVAPPEGRTPGGPIRHGLRFTAIAWTTLLSLARLLAGLS
jgi:hypothetical protein